MTWFWNYVQSLQFTTQSAHFGWGGFLTLAVALHAPRWVALAVVVSAAAFKELIIDKVPWGEGHGTPDWLDLTFYTLGALLAFGLLKWKDCRDVQYLGIFAPKIRNFWS